MIVDEGYLTKRGWPVPKVGTERATARLLCGWSVEAPVLQHQVGRYRLDFAWPQYRIALEIDGWHHDRPEQAQRGWERHRWLTRQGWLVIHVDPEAPNGEELLVQIARLIDAANPIEEQA